MLVIGPVVELGVGDGCAGVGVHEEQGRHDETSGGWETRVVQRQLSYRAEANSFISSCCTARVGILLSILKLALGIFMHVFVRPMNAISSQPPACHSIRRVTGFGPMGSVAFNQGQYSTSISFEVY